MKFTEFAGLFAAALVASVIALFAISFVVDTINGASEPVATAHPEKPAVAAKSAEPVAAEPTKSVSPAKVASAAPAAKPAGKKRHPGRKIYLRKGACAACHGRKGQRAISYYPSIAGQDKKYIITQIADIIKGTRVGGLDPATGHPSTEAMRGALVTSDGTARISNDDIRQMADWLTHLPPARPRTPETPIPAENIAKGKKLFGKCLSCHGKQGKKPLRGYPFLAGQKRQYLLMQMTFIRDKIRTNGKTKVMLPFVKKLSDEQLGMIADYLSQIDRSKK